MLPHDTFEASLPAGQCITDAVETVLSQQGQKHVVNICGIVDEFPAGAKYLSILAMVQTVFGDWTIDVIIIINYLFIAIEFPLGGSSPYTSADKTNKI